jgi:hypothetical protein
MFAIFSNGIGAHLRTNIATGSFGKERSVHRTRLFLFAAVSAVLVSLCSNNPALASDYRIEVGAETGTGKDAGAQRCTLAKLCTARLEALKLNVRVYMPRRGRAEATVFLDGDEIGCCYFTGAVDSTVVVAPDTSVTRLPFFKGARARGGLFIQNESAGVLYLRFNFFDKF